MKNLDKYKQVLIDNNYTCLLYKENQIYTSTIRGVKPLVDFIKQKIDLKDFIAIDKVVGKATAFLYVKLKVKYIFTFVISTTALEVLKKHHIEVNYLQEVKNIINRDKTDICPFEKSVLNIDNQEEAYQIIISKLRS